MRILVCGATGYLGKHIARGLREAGHEILGLARNDVASEKVASLGFTPVGSTPDELAAQIRFDIDRWSKVVRDAGIKVE